MVSKAFQEDKLLCQKIAAKDKAACRELVSSYHKLVYTMAYRLLGDRQEAEELTQETFLQVYLNAGEFRGESKLSTWIYRITYHLGLNYRRDLKRERMEIMANPLEKLKRRF